MNNKVFISEPAPDAGTQPIHPLELRHTYRLLASLPLERKSVDEIEQLADRLAGARSLLEVNRLIRPLRQNSD